MTGVAIATGVNIVFFPLSCRKIVFKDVENYVEGMRKVLGAQLDFMHTIEDHNMFRDTTEASKLRAEVHSLRGVHGNLYANLSWAKKEFAYGKLDGVDLSTIHRLFRKAFLPFTGFITMTDVFERVTKAHGWNLHQDEKQAAEEGEIDEKTTVDEYQHIMKNLHKPFGDLGHTMNSALDHILLKLELGKHSSHIRSRRNDVESPSNAREPGGAKFADRLRKDLDAFYQRREAALRAWCVEQGIQLASDSFQSEYSWLNGGTDAALFKTHRQRQLFVLLDVRFCPILMSSSK